MSENHIRTLAQVSYANANRRIKPLLVEAQGDGKSFDSVSQEVHERLMEFSGLEEQDISPEDKRMILALVRSEVIHLLDDEAKDYKASEKPAIEVEDNIPESVEQKPTVLEPMPERVFVAVNASMEASEEQADEESIGGTHQF